MTYLAAPRSAQHLSAPPRHAALRHATQQLLMEQWADATRHQQWDKANRLWPLPTGTVAPVTWLSPPVVNQRYWNDLVRRRMAALERREQRLAIDDAEWDIRREDVTR